MKKIFQYLLICSSLIWGFLALGNVFASESEDAQKLRELSVDEIVSEMGMGINLGNTFDGHTGLEPNETLWQNVKTNQKYITAIHDMGFNTIRIPVTWGNMINEDFSINEAWISRVQDVVDYAISQDMYVIVNVHHDGAEQSGWLLVESDHPAEVLDKFSGVWESIATYFKDYDEHLILESMNEVWGKTQTIQEDMKMINDLNQVFVDAVRRTGGNNDKRWLLVPGRYTNIDVNTDEKNGFKMPKDSVPNRIFVSVHDYPMGMGLTSTMGATQYSETMAKNYASSIQKLVDAYTSKGIPVILGEYGVMNKNNTVEREYYYEVITRYCAIAGIVPVAWDNGAYDLSKEADFVHALVDRETGEAIYPTIIEAMLRGMYTDATELSITGLIKPTIENPTVIQSIESIQLSKDSLSMIIGEKTQVEVTKIPAESNEKVLWSTDNSNVATVSNGIVIARGIGSTKLKVYTLSGSISQVVDVVVEPEVSAVFCELILVNSTITVDTNSFGNLYAKNGTEGSLDFLTYQSSDESIATVNRLGKVVGITQGNCEILITASSGLSKTVRVTVREKNVPTEITLALYIYYNDPVNNYFGNEQGDSVTVNGDGTYHLAFDMSSQLSAAGKSGGILGLSNIGAIYIKDVNSGNILEQCNILYKEILVDGNALTVIQTEPKAALKKSGIFDTNDPINAWDGSQVEEVDWDKGKFTVNFKDAKNPRKIEVTFELTDMKFLGSSELAGVGTINQYSGSKDMAESEQVAQEAKLQDTTVKSEETQGNNKLLIYIILIIIFLSVCVFGIIGFRQKRKG